MLFLIATSLTKIMLECCAAKKIWIEVCEVKAMHTVHFGTKMSLVLLNRVKNEKGWKRWKECTNVDIRRVLECPYSANML